MKGPRPKLSDYISGTVHRDYSSLSKLFSQVKGVTIECFAIRHRTEYAKELLSYGQQSVSEIAYALGYSSPAHLTSQFKQQTGMSQVENSPAPASGRTVSQRSGREVAAGTHDLFACQQKKNYFRTAIVLDFILSLLPVKPWQMAAIDTI